ncbi:MAG: VaFE repeat-containing surface-anchored protein [Eubacterium sp.]|nr:VaFE repeat-containing surface-anchored protein [Eubacterium sp.]
MGKVRTNRVLIASLIAVSLAVNAWTMDFSYADLKTSRKWGSDITDAKLNKYNGKSYFYKLPGVDQYACTGYTEWALNSVYGVKVPGYASTKSLRNYFIKKGNKIVAYGSHVAKAQGGNGKYYSYGEIKPGDIVFFFRRSSNSSGKVTKSPIKDSRGYTDVTGWRHVAIVGGSVSGSHGITSRMHHNTHAKGIHYSGTIKNQISTYGASKGATDYQVMRVIEPEKVKRAVKIKKSMKVNGNVLPEEKAVFRVWPKKYGKYSSKSSWWKKIPSEYKDEVKTDSKGAATTKKLPAADDGFNGKYYIYQTRGPDIVRLAKNKVITLKKGTSAVEWSYTDDSSEHPTIVKKNAMTGETVTQEGITFRLKKKGAFQKVCEYLGTGERNREAVSTDAISVSGEDGAQGITSEKGAGVASFKSIRLDGAILTEADDGGHTSSIAGSDSSSLSDDEGIDADDALIVVIEEYDEDGGDADEEDRDSGGSDDEDGGISDDEDSSNSDDDDSGGSDDENSSGSDDEDSGSSDNEESGDESGKKDFDLDEVQQIMQAFLSDDPEKELADLGVNIPDAGWVSIGGSDEFVTDENGEAEISMIGKDEAGEYEIYETESPEGFKLPGYALAVLSPESVTDLDRPVTLALESVASVVTTLYSNMPEPEISTSAADDNTGGHVGSTIKNAGLTDTVTMENLEAGKPYTIFGKLMFKDTGAPVKDVSGDEITASAIFIAEEVNGTCLVRFEFDSRVAAERDVVVFERLYEGELEEEPENTAPLASHEDLTDEDQTVSYPELPEEEPEPEEPEEPDKPDTPKPDHPRGGSTPKTGDDQMELLLLLVTVLAAAVVILTIMAVTYRDKSRSMDINNKKGKGE